MGCGHSSTARSTPTTKLSISENGGANGGKFNGYEDRGQKYNNFDEEPAYVTRRTTADRPKSLTRSRSKTPEPSKPMPPGQMTMKSAILIQRWYRRCVARLEARRRATWNIFTSLEYHSEQDQLKLYNFFSEIISGMLESENGPAGGLIHSLFGVENDVAKSSAEDEGDLLNTTKAETVKIEKSYKGPHLTFPLSQSQIEQMMNAFSNNKILHAKYVIQVLHEARNVLRNLPNVVHVNTSISNQITICGDLHGKFDDLSIIFYKNGLPSIDNPYVFNGDFVDRGPQSVEVAVTLFAFLILNPNVVVVNRGNHEDHVMNVRYGFTKEVISKYGKAYAAIISRLFEDIFGWLPLATIINNEVYVAHGGISDRTDLQYLNSINRHTYLSALRPPVVKDQVTGKKSIDVDEWKQVLDVLWSDPKNQNGCFPNVFRGGGSYFGPDVTTDFLQRHKLSLIIRSHECKYEGYEYTHDDQVLTIFSASNYYELGSNRGAYVKIVGETMTPHFVQYMANKQRKKISVKMRMSIIEESAIRSLKEKLFAYKPQLMAKFEEHDRHSIGQISLRDWCQVVEDVTKLSVPLHILAGRGLVKMSSDGKLVDYRSTFDQEFALSSKNPSLEHAPGVAESLYRHRSTLETIFRLIDKDHSGQVSMEEFEQACTLLSKFTRTPLSPEYMRQLAVTMDFNKDGYIDLNEFLEAFRLVDRKDFDQWSVNSTENHAH